MLKNYKTKAIVLLFGIITIINIILLSTVYIAYSDIIKEDYEEKLSSVANQTVTNANLVLSFLEEEIEIFVNKYKLEEKLDTYSIDVPNFVRAESTSFEQIVIFNTEEPVYISNSEFIDFYRELMAEKKKMFNDKTPTSMWFIDDGDEVLERNAMLIYIRELYQNGTNEKIGYIIADTSIEELLRLLNLKNTYVNSKKREFLPDYIGMSVGDKILTLGENTGVDNLICKKGEFPVAKNDICFYYDYSGHEFYSVHNTKGLIRRMEIVFLLFVFLFVVILILSYKILNYILNEICGRIDNLNNKMDIYSTINGEKKT